MLGIHPIPQIFAYTDRAMQSDSSSRFAISVLYTFVDNCARCTLFSASGFPVTHFISPSIGSCMLGDNLS